MMRSKRVASGIVILLASAATAVEAGHGSTGDGSYGAAFTIERIEDQSYRLLRMAQSDTNPRSYRDRQMLREIEGLVLRARGLSWALDEELTLSSRRIEWLAQGLVEQYERSSRAVAWFRLPYALDAYVDLGSEIAELEDTLRAGGCRLPERNRARFDARDRFDDERFARPHDDSRFGGAIDLDRYEDGFFDRGGVPVEEPVGRRLPPYRGR